MGMHEYKVTLGRPFKADKVTAVVHAHTAADACTQAQTHFSGDGDLRVTEVAPTAEPGSDDPDRVQFRKDLADIAPPFGTQEVIRQLKALCTAITGASPTDEVDTSVQEALMVVWELREKARDVGVIEARMNLRITGAENQVTMCNADLEQTRDQLQTVTTAIMGQTLDTPDRQFEGALHMAKHLRGVEVELDHALKNVAKVCVAINPGSDKDKGTWVEQALVEAERLHQRAASAKDIDKQMVEINKELHRLCEVVNPEHLEIMGSYVDKSVAEAERLMVRIAHLEGLLESKPLAMTKKFDQALKVIELFEVSYPLRDSQRAAIAEFRQYHPKPGP